MDLEKATPQQIYDYKREWMHDAYLVPIHSDIEREGVKWCKDFLDRWHYHIKKHTDVYEHTFCFEFEEDAIDFKDLFCKFK